MLDTNTSRDNITFSAYLYMIDAETAKNLYKQTKLSKDYVHAGQLNFVHWRNSIEESTNMIRHYGLIPEIKNGKRLKDMFPPVSAIYNRFEMSDDPDTKEAFNSVIKYFLNAGLLGTQASRTLGKQSFYNEDSSLLLYHKLMHAMALGMQKKGNKNIPFLACGLYHGCKKKPKEQLRDNLYYKKKDTNIPVKVEQFKSFRLISNDIFLDPSSTAAYLFVSKVAPKNATRRLNNVRKWNTHNNQKPYVSMPSDDSEDNSDVEIQEVKEKHTSKAFTKSSFKEPTNELSSKLDAFRNNLQHRNQQASFWEVLDKFNTIQKMTGHGKLFKSPDEEDGEENEHTEEEDEEEEEYKGGSAEHGKESSENEEEETSDSDSDESIESSHNDDDSESSNDAAYQHNDNDDDESINSKKKGKDGKDDRSTSSKIGNEGKEDDNQDGDDHNSTRNKENHIEELKSFIEKQDPAEISLGGLTGKSIQDTLGLSKAPHLRSTNYKEYFCVFQSKKMTFIKELFKKNLPFETVVQEHKDISRDDIWIQTLVDHMRKLNWSTSIDGLPEGNEIEDEKFILLWYCCDRFIELFMSTDESAQPKSPSSQDGANTRRNLEKTTYSQGNS